MSRVLFDPLDPGYQRNPYPHYPALREHPAVWVEHLGAWFVGRHRDVLAMVSDPAVFSNGKFNEISKGEFNYAPDAAQLVATDPPEHTRLRRLAGQAFRPPRIRALEATIASVTKQYLDPLASAGGPFDFAGDFADRIPIHVISEMLGVDPAMGQTFKTWTADILSASNRSRMSSDELAQIRRSVDEARTFFLGQIDYRRTHPGKDVISAFLRAQEESDSLSTEEIVGLSILLLIGGDETTAHLLGNAMVALWDHPEQLELVREDPILIPAAIEEALRYDAPVQTVFLTTTQDVAIDDMQIPEGAAVIGVWGSANRDPEYVADPDRFDLTRGNVGHLAFGHGPHFCLGAVLARVQARIVLEQLFERLPGLARRPDAPVEWIPSFWVRGPRSLPVIL
jgi:cytochrome P450